MNEEELFEQIWQRAYQIWLDEGCPHGRDRIHWLHAVAEFREQLQPERSNAKGKGTTRRSPRLNGNRLHQREREQPDTDPRQPDNAARSPLISD